MTKATSMTLESLIKNMLETYKAINDFSCRIVSIHNREEGLIEAERATDCCTPQPRFNEKTVWVKKPYKMRVQSELMTVIYKKEDEQFLYYKIITGKKPELLKSAQSNWPEKPSPESDLEDIQKLAKEPVSHVVEGKKDLSQYIYFELTFTRYKNDRYADERFCYYIRQADWTLFKTAFYIGDRLTSSYEIKDFKANMGLSDELFEISNPETAKEK